MKIAFLGDSITAGCGASCYDKCYVSLVKNTIACEVKNYGIPATSITKYVRKAPRPEWYMDFIERAKTIDEDVDYVFVFGGTNDFGHSIEIGALSDTDEYVFCGAVRSLISILSDKFGKEKIRFVLPLRRFGDDIPNPQGAILKDYIDKLRLLLDEYNVDYIDLFINGFPKPKTNMGDLYTTDGLHPNDYGHQFVAEIISKYICEKL